MYQIPEERIIKGLFIPCAKGLKHEVNQPDFTPSTLSQIIAEHMKGRICYNIIYDLDLSYEFDLYLQEVDPELFKKLITGGIS